MKHCLPLCLLLAPALYAAAPIKVLIIDGQNNHKWEITTPILKKDLESAGKFQVDVSTTPPKGADMSAFKPNFAAYKVVLSNYNGDPWPKETQEAFEQFVRNGGGFVVYHAADNAFPDWPAYNAMIGLGGWGGRSEKSGAYIHFKAGDFVQESQARPKRPSRQAARVPGRDPQYGSPHHQGPAAHLDAHQGRALRQPARPGGNMHVLATAMSDQEQGGSGENEPMLMVINYGAGRVFHTVLGHAEEAMSDVGFIVTLQRGTEWAATGKVTQKIPADFPSATQTSTRP